MKVKKNSTNQIYAAKLFEKPFQNQTTARQALREIKLLRKLTQILPNDFTASMYDILIPKSCKVTEYDEDLEFSMVKEE